MTKIVERCRLFLEGSEDDFIASLLGVEIPVGHEDECSLLADSLAKTFPTEFVRAVGNFLLDSEVA